MSAAAAASVTAAAVEAAVSIDPSERFAFWRALDLPQQLNLDRF
jgi:hypothetical protein